MKALIEKYFEGETSLEEEARLRAYFNGEEVSEDLKVYQPLFEHFTNEQSQELSADFDKKLFQNLENQDGKIVQMRAWPKYLLRIAAVGAVLLAAMIYLSNPTAPAQQTAAIDWSKYEVTDEKVAYEETVKALKLLSSKLNKGTKKAGKEMKELEKVGKYLN